MNADFIKLEPPFYLPEAVDQFVRPVVPDLVGHEIPSTALDAAPFCEALNRALKVSIESAS
jgi:hypothetical protein